MRFRIFTEIFDLNPWFSILASYGQEVAPATETTNQKNAIEFETRDMNAEKRNYTL